MVQGVLSLVYMAVSASADGNDWYDTDVLPAGAAAGSVQSKGAGNSTATRPITLGIAWKLSGNMWFAKGMLDPTVPLSRTLLDHSGMDANGQVHALVPRCDGLASIRPSDPTGDLEAV